MNFLMKRFDGLFPRLHCSVFGALVSCGVAGVSSQALAQGQPAIPATPPPAAAPAPGTPPATAPATPPAAETPAATTDSAAPATAPADAPTESSSTTTSSGGGGLFEQAQAEAEPGSGESKGAGLPFDLNGYIRGDAFVGKRSRDDNWETKAAYGEFALKLRTKKLTFGDAYAETRFLYGLQSEQTGPKVDVREAYVNGYFGPLDVRIGQQIIVWGRADAFNPTNNVTPLDLRVHSPVEDDRRQGNLAVRANLNFSPIRLEGVWVPLYRPSEIPVEPPQYVNLSETDFPRPDIKNGSEGARVHLELPAFEMSVSYLYGFAPLPGLNYSRTVLGTPDLVHVARKPYEQHVIGFDFSTAIGDLMGLRAEAALREPLHYESRVYAPNPDLQYVLGIDHAFGSVNVIAQYMGKYTFDWKREDAPPADTERLQQLTDETWIYDQGSTARNNAIAEVEAQVQPILYVTNQMLFSQLERVQHLATVRIEWLTLHDTLSISALGFMNFSTQEWLVFPKLGYQITDALSTSVGAEIYGGPNDTLFGTIDAKLSAGYAELRYAF